MHRRAPFLAILNDDATAHPEWLAVFDCGRWKRSRMSACARRECVLAGDGRLDSAGMLLCPDGSSKQRGHLEAPGVLSLRRQEVLLPSGSAAFYRRAMLEEIGLFDESFFLYCEDTDLGLRARWAAWKCLYVPDAVVEHRYSHSAGKASALKAYYVERNRLFLVVKNFPLLGVAARAVLLAGSLFLACRFSRCRAAGKAAEFQRDGNSGVQLPVYRIARAYLAAVDRDFPRYGRQRREMKRRLTSRQFRRLIRRYSISPRQVAAL